MSKITAIIYLVKDKHGNQRSAVAEDSGDTVQIAIRYDEHAWLYFESEAYHLKSWCKENGLKYKEVRKTFEFDTLWSE